MGDSIPVGARTRIIGRALESLNRLDKCVASVIPVTRDVWMISIADSGLSRYATRLEPFETLLLDSVDLDNGGELRASSARIAGAAKSLDLDLRCLCSLSPARSSEASDLRDAIIDLAISKLKWLSGSTIEEPHEPHATLNSALRRLLDVENAYPFTSDSCKEAFGIPYADTLDSSGIFSPVRLLASYYGRYEQLARRFNSVLSAVTASPPDLLNALMPAEALVLTSHPLISLRTAIQVLELFRHEYQSDPQSLARPLIALKLDVNRSATNHAGMVRAIVQNESATSDAERADIALELYRRMIEGQLRPWAWTLLRIHRRSGSIAPKLSVLREQLIADGLPLMLDAAEAILPDARNASAHEDYLWDADAGQLQIGGSHVSLEHLEGAFNRAYAFVAGAECAFRCSRTEMPGLARLLDSEDPPDGLQSNDSRRAMDHFGTNGLNVRRWSYDKRLLVVDLDVLSLNSVDPCFQAAVGASHVLSGAEGILVTLDEGEITAMNLPRKALDANFQVWQKALNLFSVMPISTFLPLNAAARIAVESQGRAAEAIAWFALDDVLRAFDESINGPDFLPSLKTHFAPRLELAAASLDATAAILQAKAIAPIKDALDLIMATIDTVASVSGGSTAAPVMKHQSLIERLYNRLPQCQLLPTVSLSSST